MENKIIHKAKEKSFLIVTLFYILPALLIYLEIIPFSLRFWILILGAITIIVLSSFSKLSLKDYGFQCQNLIKSLKAIAFPTFSLSLLMFIYYLINGPRIDNSMYGLGFYIFFVVISSPLQEFLYRGYLFAIFSQAQSSAAFQIIMSSVVYSWIHVIYEDLPTLLLTLVIGLFWGWHYTKFRNIYSVTLSHAFLGVVAILCGLI